MEWSKWQGLVSVKPWDQNPVLSHTHTHTHTHRYDQEEITMSSMSTGHPPTLERITKDFWQTQSSAGFHLKLEHGPVGKGSTSTNAFGVCSHFIRLTAITSTNSSLVVQASHKNQGNDLRESGLAFSPGI
jgi:hypothetical protein